MDELVPGALAGAAGPWDRTDAGERMEAARRLATTAETVERALDVLDRCLAHAAAHPHSAALHEQVLAMPELKAIEDAWPSLLKYLRRAMPTLRDVTDDGVAAALQLAAQDGADVPEPQPMRDFTRMWLRAEVPALARQASQWLSERLPGDPMPQARERYFRLLAALVPNLGDSGNGLVTHLEMVGGMDAAAYLLCVERHPATGPTARETARDYLDALERHAYPQGEDLPPEVWAVRGRRLSAVRRLYVDEAGGVPQDQMAELTFDDGRAIQLWAGYEQTLRVESGRYEVDDGESTLTVPGADQAVLLAEGVVACLADDTAGEPLNHAVGRRLTDPRPLLHGDALTGVRLRFESVVLDVRVTGDLVLQIGAEVPRGNEG
ncbi:hypothetical protein E1293_22945 [Actinomadura darangshiensis]|uniref:Uncharacterized protein n=1 Tax=Actinomadura darangshiensis TaxID=705336 RepID=A0A4R5B5G9_9ACTN|nr:hypothetical protein [Actinomadura darangshiensis]TDD79606.1 hypothetical protein E1293_22945 [Actinomadura darangshiensis]